MYDDRELIRRYRLDRDGFIRDGRDQRLYNKPFGPWQVSQGLLGSLTAHTLRLLDPKNLRLSM